MKIIKNLKWIVILLGMSLLLAACGMVELTLETPAAHLVVTEQIGENRANLFTDPSDFQSALLQAIQSRDQMGLEQLMTENFTSGWWRGEMGDQPRDDALRELYSDQLGSPGKVGTAANVDLIALMGGTDPLGILRPEVGVVSTLVMTGWGKDGEDEAVLFVARQPDGSLRWAGTMMIIGGFTSPQTGGVQLLVNASHGYQMYLPLGVEVMQSNPNEISIRAPQGSEGERGRVDITVEPAGGLTVEQVVEQLKPSVLADVADQPATVFGLDTEPGMVFDRVPSQEIMRLLFVVHEDRLYRMYFYPQDDAQPTAYAQMRNIYAVITNTFKFIPLESNVPVKLGGADMVADPQVFTSQLQQGLIERNKVTLQSMMGDSFTLAAWQSEGIQITPGDAIQQILNNYVPLGVQPVLDLNHPLIARLYPQHPISDAGEELIPVFAAGWGQEGKDEAILFIARRADGSLYWQGVLTAVDGFGTSGETEVPMQYSDPASFEDELLQVINARDAARLQGLMTDPFINGIWRGDRTENPAAVAVNELLTTQLHTGSQLTVVNDADLKALMGVEDPLAILGDQAIVLDAFLVNGWGKDGQDEAILFVTSQPDDSLKLHAWIVVQGGFSGARLGGVQHFNNVAGGYSLYLPLDTEITTQSDNHVAFLGADEGPMRGMAFITLEPAKGRNVEQVYEDVKADLGGDFNLSSTTLWIDYYPALVVTGLPGQDVNRQIFIVQNDTVYHMLFMPDSPQGGEGYQHAYQQMLDLYAMIVNTFHFTQ